jgi:hypothetical protein
MAFHSAHGWPAALAQRVPASGLWRTKGPRASRLDDRESGPRRSTPAFDSCQEPLRSKSRVSCIEHIVASRRESACGRAWKRLTRRSGTAPRVSSRGRERSPGLRARRRSGVQHGSALGVRSSSAQISRSESPLRVGRERGPRAPACRRSPACRMQRPGRPRSLERSRSPCFESLSLHAVGPVRGPRPAGLASGLATATDTAGLCACRHSTSDRSPTRHEPSVLRVPILAQAQLAAAVR